MDLFCWIAPVLKRVLSGTKIGGGFCPECDEQIITLTKRKFNTFL